MTEAWRKVQPHLLGNKADAYGKAGRLITFLAKCGDATAIAALGVPGNAIGNRSRPYAEGSGRLRRNVTRIPGSQMVNSNPRSVANFSIASNRKDEVFSSGGKKRPSSCSKTMQNFRVFRRSSMCSERASMSTTKQEAGLAINRDNAYSDSVIGRHISLHARASRRRGSPTRRRLSSLWRTAYLHQSVLRFDRSVTRRANSPFGF